MGLGESGPEFPRSLCTSLDPDSCVSAQHVFPRVHKASPSLPCTLVLVFSSPSLLFSPSRKARVLSQHIHLVWVPPHIPSSWVHHQVRRSHRRVGVERSPRIAATVFALRPHLRSSAEQGLT